MERTPLTGSMAKLLSTSPERIVYRKAALIPISLSVAYITKFYELQISVFNYTTYEV